MNLHKNTILGLDIGIGSIGWAMVKQNENGNFTPLTFTDAQGNNLTALGVRAFDVPENPKDKKLKNVNRREKRRQRVTLKRKRKRMAAVRHLLVEYDLLADAKDLTIHGRSVTNESPACPWKLRKEGLSRRLTDLELAIILIHMAKHRGFQSNSKADGVAKKNSDAGKMLTAISQLQTAMQDSGAETAGAYMATLPSQRNRQQSDGVEHYTNTMLRDLLREEAALLCNRQQQFGQSKFSNALLTSYLEIAFQQKPLQSVEHLIGYCTFEPNEKRAPKLSYTSEKFRLAQRLTILRLVYPNGSSKSIAPEKTREISGTIGTKKSFTYKALRKALSLPENVQFEGLPYGSTDTKGKIVDAEKHDIVMRTKGCAEGSSVFYSLFGKAGYGSFTEKRTAEGVRIIDEVARIVSVNDDIDVIQQAIEVLPLTPNEQRILLDAVREGTFAKFSGTVNLSIKAMENILPHMIEARDYAAGCELAGYDHAKAQPVDINAVHNPVVRKVMKEVRKQVQAIMRETGIIPEKVHVELLRDMGKSAAERTSIDIGINRRTKEKKSNRVEFAEQLGRSPETITATELIRYELWKEQGGKCAYWMLRKNAESITGGHIRITDLQDSSTALQIDHILPRSRTFDNSFHNLCLCTADANQAKKNRTPWEWIGCRNEKAWHKYETWIKSLRIKGLKKRNYLLKNLSEDVAGRFHARNLSDSRYATKLVLAWLEEEYERLGVDCHDQLGKEIKRFRARPGQLTAILRKAWGVNGLKYDSDNNRIGDRHHALDALVVACATESTLQKMTSLYKQMENNAARYRLVPNAEKPWGGFVKDTRKLLNDVFVSRAERGSTKGALHKDTLRQIRTEEDGYGNEIKRVYERKAIADLTEKDLCNIKDADRNSRLITILRDWISNGKPLDTPPLSPKGDPISKIRICTGRFSSGICVKRGQGIAQADNGSIVRTDVYTQNGKFYLVPVYTHHVAKGIVPNRAAKALKDEKYWDVVDESYDFCFSLQPNCYVVTEDKKGKVVEGYYGGMNRRTCTITLNKPFDKSTPPLTPGTKTLKSLTKYRVDRFGRLHKVHTEPRP